MIKAISIDKNGSLREFNFEELKVYLKDWNLANNADKPSTLWIDFANPTQNEETILSDYLNLHQLAIEDCKYELRNSSHHEHLPKIEDYDNYIFVIINHVQAKNNSNISLSPNSEISHKPALTLHSATAERVHFKNEITIEPHQLSAFLLEHIIVTYHIHRINAIEKVLDNAYKNPKIFHHGADYIYQLILDESVDEIQPILNKFDKAIEDIEGEIFQKPTQNTLSKILWLKRNLFRMRRIITYQREITYRLSRGDFELINEHESRFYRNVYDHLVRATELTESYRDSLSSLLDAYLSTTSNKMNEVMKVLTIISTFFLPLTFIAGVYGMNFKFMPELDWYYGYAMCIGLMIVTSLGMYIFFRKKGWL